MKDPSDYLRRNRSLFFKSHVKNISPFTSSDNLLGKRCNEWQDAAMCAMLEIH